MKHFAQSRVSTVGGLLAFLMLTAACGRDTKVYSDPTPPPTASTVTIIDGTSALPKGFYDQSVNSASVDVALDGDSSNSTALRLQTKPVSTNDVGGFNGNDTGNRALLGVDNYDSAPLASLQPLTFDGAYYGGGTSFLSLNLIVDMNCDFTNLRVIVADGPTLASLSTPVDAEYAHLNADFTQSVWRSSAASIKDSNGNEVLPSASSGFVSSLTSLLAAYPNACIINASSGDDGLPAGLPTAGVLFSLGSPNTTGFNGAFISRLTIGNKHFDFTQMGEQ